MGETSAIEWTDATWNPLRGCTRVSEGCRNCYAERMAARFSGPGMPFEGLATMTKQGPRWTGEVRLLYAEVDRPLRWRKPRRIFVDSVSDLFHEKVPFEFIALIYDTMRQATWHVFQILTKRAERMHKFISWYIRETFDGAVEAFLKAFRHVWHGVSVEDQEAADARIPWLLATPSAVRILSCEPLLGFLDLSRYLWRRMALSEMPAAVLDSGAIEGLAPRAAIHQIMAGGESGPKARVVHPDAFRSLRDQAVAAGVKFFFKQWGEWLPNAKEYGCYQQGANYNRRHVFVGDVAMVKVGKKAAGKLLDGRTWEEFPEVAA